MVTFKDGFAWGVFLSGVIGLFAMGIYNVTVVPEYTEAMMLRKFYPVYIASAGFVFIGGHCILRHKGD